MDISIYPKSGKVEISNGSFIDNFPIKKKQTAELLEIIAKADPKKIRILDINETAYKQLIKIKEENQ